MPRNDTKQRSSVDEYNVSVSSGDIYRELFERVAVYLGFDRSENEGDMSITGVLKPEDPVDVFNAIARAINNGEVPPDFYAESKAKFNRDTGIDVTNIRGISNEVLELDAKLAKLESEATTVQELPEVEVPEIPAESSLRGEFELGDNEVSLGVGEVGQEAEATKRPGETTKFQSDEELERQRQAVEVDRGDTFAETLNLLRQREDTARSAEEGPRTTNVETPAETGDEVVIGEKGAKQKPVVEVPQSGRRPKVPVGDLGIGQAAVSDVRKEAGTSSDTSVGEGKIGGVIEPGGEVISPISREKKVEGPVVEIEESVGQIPQVQTEGEAVSEPEAQESEQPDIAAIQSERGDLDTDIIAPRARGADAELEQVIEVAPTPITEVPVQSEGKAKPSEQELQEKAQVSKGSSGVKNREDVVTKPQPADKVELSEVEDSGVLTPEQRAKKHEESGVATNEQVEENREVTPVEKAVDTKAKRIKGEVLPAEEKTPDKKKQRKTPFRPRTIIGESRVIEDKVEGPVIEIGESVRQIPQVQTEAEAVSEPEAQEAEQPDVAAVQPERSDLDTKVRRADADLKQVIGVESPHAVSDKPESEANTSLQSPQEGPQVPEDVAALGAASKSTGGISQGLKSNDGEAQLDKAVSREEDSGKKKSQTETTQKRKVDVTEEREFEVPSEGKQVGEVKSEPRIKTKDAVSRLQPEGEAEVEQTVKFPTLRVDEKDSERFTGSDDEASFKHETVAIPEETPETEASQIAGRIVTADRRVEMPMSKREFLERANRAYENPDPTLIPVQIDLLIDEAKSRGMSSSLVFDLMSEFENRLIAPDTRPIGEKLFEAEEKLRREREAEIAAMKVETRVARLQAEAASLAVPDRLRLQETSLTPEEINVKGRQRGIRYRAKMSKQVVRVDVASREQPLLYEDQKAMEALEKIMPAMIYGEGEGEFEVEGYKGKFKTPWSKYKAKYDSRGQFRRDILRPENQLEREALEAEVARETKVSMLAEATEEQAILDLEEVGIYTEHIEEAISSVARFTSEVSVDQLFDGVDTVGEKARRVSMLGPENVFVDSPEHYEYAKTAIDAALFENEPNLSVEERESIAETAATTLLTRADSMKTSVPILSVGLHETPDGDVYATTKVVGDDKSVHTNSFVIEDDISPEGISKSFRRKRMVKLGLGESNINLAINSSFLTQEFLAFEADPLAYMFSAPFKLTFLQFAPEDIKKKYFEIMIQMQGGDRMAAYQKAVHIVPTLSKMITNEVKLMTNWWGRDATGKMYFAPLHYGRVGFHHMLGGFAKKAENSYLNSRTVFNGRFAAGERISFKDRFKLNHKKRVAETLHKRKRKSILKLLMGLGLGAAVGAVKDAIEGVLETTGTGRQILFDLRRTSTTIRNAFSGISNAWKYGEGWARKPVGLGVGGPNALRTIQYRIGQTLRAINVTKSVVGVLGKSAFKGLGVYAISALLGVPAPAAIALGGAFGLRSLAVSIANSEVLGISSFTREVAGGGFMGLRYGTIAKNFRFGRWLSEAFYTGQSSVNQILPDGSQKAFELFKRTPVQRVIRSLPVHGLTISSWLMALGVNPALALGIGVGGDLAVKGISKLLSTNAVAGGLNGAGAAVSNIIGGINAGVGVVLGLGALHEMGGIQNIFSSGWSWKTLGRLLGVGSIIFGGAILGTMVLSLATLPAALIGAAVAGGVILADAISQSLGYGSLWTRIVVPVFRGVSQLFQGLGLSPSNIAGSVLGFLMGLYQLFTVRNLEGMVQATVAIAFGLVSASGIFVMSGLVAPVFYTPSYADPSSANPASILRSEYFKDVTKTLNTGKSSSTKLVYDITYTYTGGPNFDPANPDTTGDKMINVFLKDKVSGIPEEFIDSSDCTKFQKNLVGGYMTEIDPESPSTFVAQRYFIPSSADVIELRFGAAHVGKLQKTDFTLCLKKPIEEIPLSGNNDSFSNTFIIGGLAVPVGTLPDDPLLKGPNNAFASANDSRNNALEPVTLFRNPLDSGTITSDFGCRSDPFATKDRTWCQDYHTGIDIGGLPVGTPVYATKGGEVISSRFDTDNGWGNLVLVDHGDGTSTYYGHLNERNVDVGAKVEQGQQIGTLGQTGNVTGPHLHFEIRVDGVSKDPCEFIQCNAY